MPALQLTALFSFFNQRKKEKKRKKKIQAFVKVPLNAFACSLPAAQNRLAPAQRRGCVWDAAEQRGARADVSETSQQALGFHHFILVGMH